MAVRLRTWLVVGGVAAIVAVGYLATRSPSAPATRAAPATLGAAGGPAGPPATLRVLQFNLCDSGFADCFTHGRAVVQAAAVIRDRVPDLVTLNEICEADLPPLRQALQAAGRGVAVSAFRAAGDRRSGGPYRCVNGQPYGNGLLVRLPATGTAYTTRSGLYPAQDPSDPEERAWLCLDAVHYLTACTTHLVAERVALAQQQCRELHDLLGLGGPVPVVAAGDFNLAGGGRGGLGPCLGPHQPVADDGAAQHVLASPDLAVTAVETIPMRGTTDHPGLLVTLARNDSRPRRG